NRYVEHRHGNLPFSRPQFRISIVSLLDEICDVADQTASSMFLGCEGGKWDTFSNRSFMILPRGFASYKRNSARWWFDRTRKPPGGRVTKIATKAKKRVDAVFSDPDVSTPY